MACPARWCSPARPDARDEHAQSRPGQTRGSPYVGPARTPASDGSPARAPAHDDGQAGHGARPYGSAGEWWSG